MRIPRQARDDRKRARDDRRGLGMTGRKFPIKSGMTKEVMEKGAIPLEVGGNHENDYLRAKCANLK